MLPCGPAFLTGMPGWSEILIILVVLLLLFGTRLPTVMRSLGKGVSEFKKGLKDVEDDATGKPDANESTAAKGGGPVASAPPQPTDDGPKDGSNK